MKKYLYQDKFYYVLLLAISALICFKTFNYGFIYDDRLLVSTFLESPMNYKFEAMRKYAKFHFYPIYFLSHTLDQILTSIFFNLENYLDEKRIIIPRITNYVLHLLNSFIIFNLLKRIFKTNDYFILFIGASLFLLHPAISQPLFNVTARNELLYICFSLLAFFKSFDFIENNHWKNCLKVNLLFFLALCSKLFAVIYVVLIPSYFLLKALYEKKLSINRDKILVLFLSLCFTLCFYYFLRYLNTNSYDLIIDENFLKNIFSSIHFYTRSLFFPLEHFYTNVFFTNTNLIAGISIFTVLFIIFLFSIFEFYKQKSFTLLFYFFWLGSSLSLPLYFGTLTPESFPLTSELNERYVYGSSVTISYLVVLILLRLKKFKNFFNYSVIVCIFLLMCSAFLLNDRSKVYKNDYVFWYSSTYNHENHLFNHIIPALLKLTQNDFDRAIFHAYQNYALYPESIQNVLVLYNILLKKGDLTNAKNIYDKIYIGKFGDHPMIQFLRTDNLIQVGKFKEAIPLLDNVIEYYENDNWEDAVKIHHEDATIIDFSKDDLYFKLGVCYANLGDKKRAFEYFEKAYLYNRLHTTAKYNAALIAKDLGDSELAIKLLKEAVDQNPKFKQMMQDKINN